MGKENSAVWRTVFRHKISKRTGILLIGIMLISIVIFIFIPDVLFDRFLKDQILIAYAKEYPESSLKIHSIHFNVLKNRIECDSIFLKTGDSRITFKAASLSVSGISWMRLLLERKMSANVLYNSTINIHTIRLCFIHSQSVVQLAALHISLPDSAVTVDSLKYSTVLSDEQFFAKSQFRQTRYRFYISRIAIKSLDLSLLKSWERYNATNLTLNGAYADILVNMDKPYEKASKNPQMPNEILTSMKETIRIDALKLTNGQVNYCERYVEKAQPGKITFTKINIEVHGISNHTPQPGIIRIHGSGYFMNEAYMVVNMSMPLVPKHFTLQYSGSFLKLDATKLNSFLVLGEHRRIKSGELESATYNVNVVDGNATGSLYMAYKELSIAILNKKTGSENGVFNQIASLIGKLYIIRGNNLPDGIHPMRIGEIKYTRKADDYFMQYLWFSLRSGVGDVVGF